LLITESTVTPTSCVLRRIDPTKIRPHAASLLQTLERRVQYASAFGLYVAANILKTQQLPAILKVNAIGQSQFRNILLYNQYRGIDHSFTLIRHVQTP
jgi:hypothetical protein